MADLTIERQKALALAAARARQRASSGAGSDAYNDALEAGSKASQFFNKSRQPSLEGSAAATVNGLVNGIPVLGPAVQNLSDAIVGTGYQLAGQGTMQEYRQRAQEGRRRTAEANPIASIAGNIGGATAAFGAGGATATGARALGLSGGLGQQVVNSTASTLGLTTADNIVRGEAPVEALANAVLPSAVSGTVPVVGQAVRKGVDAATDAATRSAQDKLTTAAIGAAPDAATLRSQASAMFDASTGGTPLAITDNAFFRFLGGVQQFSNKLRINADNDPQATGLLSTLMRIADDTSQGVAVDLKDLHLVRQLARKVSGSAQGRDAALGNKVVEELDNLIQGLKPADILGGADPAAATSALLGGISTWSRASKVGVIEEAIEKAGTYKSGLENGLRLQFQKVLRDPKQRKLFTAAERQEMQKVANGTAASNAVTLLGKFGFSNSGAPNWMGGITGFAAGSMTPLGPIGGLAAAGVGAGARRLSEKMGVDAANRAAQVVATPNIPVAPAVTAPRAIGAGITAAELAARGALIGG